MAVESERIRLLFESLYNGQPWIDVTTIDSLKNISASQAAKKISPDTNSIWQLVVHLVRWREQTLQRLKGVIIPAPADNFLTPPDDISDKAWKNVLKQLDESQKMWLEAFSGFDDDMLSKKIRSSPFTNYELIHGILQHDAYHLGQMNLLKKFL